MILNPAPHLRPLSIRREPGPILLHPLVPGLLSLDLAREPKFAGE